MNKLINKVFNMKSLIVTLVCLSVLCGCNNDFKILDGIEVPPEKIDDLAGVWVSDYCHIEDDVNMNKPTIKIDEYGNITYGKRHYITDPLSDHPSYKCEGGFTERTDSVDYINSVIDSPWSYSDGSSAEYVKVIGLNSGATVAFEAKHYYHQDGITLYKAFMSEKAVASNKIEHLDVDVIYERVSL